MSLSHLDWEQYRHKGFVRFDRIIGDDEVARLGTLRDRLVDRSAPVAGGTATDAADR